jgi:hypothetical protein
MTHACLCIDPNTEMEPGRGEPERGPPAKNLSKKLMPLNLGGYMFTAEWGLGRLATEK